MLRIAEPIVRIHPSPAKSRPRTWCQAIAEMLFAIESALAIFHRALSEAWVDPPGVADPADDLFAVGFFRSYAG